MCSFFGNWIGCLSLFFLFFCILQDCLGTCLIVCPLARRSDKHSGPAQPAARRSRTIIGNSWASGTLAACLVGLLAAWPLAKLSWPTSVSCMKRCAVVACGCRAAGAAESEPRITTSGNGKPCVARWACRGKFSYRWRCFCLSRDGLAHGGVDPDLAHQGRLAPRQSAVHVKDGSSHIRSLDFITKSSAKHPGMCGRKTTSAEQTRIRSRKS